MEGSVLEGDVFELFDALKIESTWDLVAGYTTFPCRSNKGWGEGSEDMSDLAGKVLGFNSMYVFSSPNIIHVRSA